MAERQTATSFDALHWALLSFREPKVMEGLTDFENQYNLFKNGKHREVRQTLKRRTARVVTYWMRMFGSRRGAPRVHDPSFFRLLGVYRRRKRLSWSELAKLVNPKMMREKPTRYNIQQAVLRAEKESKPSKNRLAL